MRCFMRRLIRLVLALLAFGVIPACGTNQNSTPPTFGGITGATSTVVRQATLTWNAAVDYSGGGITYLVAWSTTTGAEAFGSANSTSTTTPTGITITGLTSTSTYYFMVRAQDANGLQDVNVPIPESSALIQ
jgi:hypothetical protein